MPNPPHCTLLGAQDPPHMALFAVPVQASGQVCEDQVPVELHVCSVLSSAHLFCPGAQTPMHIP
jgi:hypothetical protein